MKATTSKSMEAPVFELLEPRLLLSGGSLLSEVLSFGAGVQASSAAVVISVEGKSTKPGKGGGGRGDDYGDSLAAATAALLDSLGSAYLTGKIDRAGDVDFISIVATQTGQMQLDLSPLANRKNDVSGDLSIYDASGVLIAADADPADIQASLSIDVIAGQTYYLRVAGLDGTVGKYDLNISTLAAPEPDPDPAPEPEPEPEPNPEPMPDPDPSPTGDYVPGSVVSWYTESLADGLGLVVLGTDAADQITVSASDGSTIIITSTGTYTLSDTFTSVQLFGFGGDDLLVSISGVSEMIYGGAGFDSFWADSLDIIGDAEAAEQAAASIHWVGEFYQPTSDPSQYVSLELSGQNIVDPTAIYSYSDYSGNPLFVDGPEYDDVAQGGVGDCYFLAAVSSLSESDPGVIEQMIAPMGDGTYAVRFYDAGQEVYLRVDAELPHYYYRPAYAQLTPDGELWVALAEKAYAQFRTGENSYDSLSGGWMGPVYTQITNMSVTGATTSTMSDDALAQYIADHLEAGHAVSAGSGSTAPDPVVGSHGYMVKSLEVIDGEYYVTVYNVWGEDGNDWDADYWDGLITLSLDMYRQSFPQMAVSLA